MSDDELLILLISAACAGFVWSAWYTRPLRIAQFRNRGAGQPLLALVPLVGAGILLLVLKKASAYDVRDDTRYVSLYFALGAAWVALGTRILPFVGISPRDDVFEGGNMSAAYVVAGAILAITLCFAGGNVGNGPGWWVVVFSATLATLALLSVWLLFEALVRISDRVTIDREQAAGIRLGGFLVASGLILGRAVAGDWVSAPATVSDFLIIAWPVLLLLFFGVAVEMRLRPTPERFEQPILSRGLVPATAYIAIAVLYVMRLGYPA